VTAPCPDCGSTDPARAAVSRLGHCHDREACALRATTVTATFWGKTYPVGLLCKGGCDRPAWIDHRGTLHPTCGAQACVEIVRAQILRANEEPADWRDLAAAAYTGWLEGDDLIGPMKAIESALLSAAPRSATASSATDRERLEAWIASMRDMAAGSDVPKKLRIMTAKALGGADPGEHAFSLLRAHRARHPATGAGDGESPPGSIPAGSVGASGAERPENATRCLRHPDDQQWLGDRYETCGACALEMHHAIMRCLALVDNMGDSVLSPIDALRLYQLAICELRGGGAKP
jgi:hypothetical protein